MLRNILVALDDTPGAVAARDAAIALARASGAALTAAVVLDRPHTNPDHEALPVGGAAFKAQRDEKLTAQVEAEAETVEAALATAAGDLSYRLIQLEDAPEPALIKAGAAQDLIVLGRDCTLGGEAADGGVAPVIEALLHDRGRPLLVLPPGPPRGSGPVVMAYDGSAPSKTAMRLALELGLVPDGARLVVAAVAETEAEARSLAQEGAALLPGAAAEALPLVGDDAGALIPEAAGRLGAWLVVMGAFGSGGLTRLLRGSTTHRLLRDSPAAVFVKG